MVGLITRIKEALKPREEIPAKEYYSEFLEERDREPLEKFILEFAEGLEAGGLKPTILAVGSSLDSKIDHKYEDDDKKVHDHTYRNIDLRADHERGMNRVAQVAEIREALASKGYSYRFDQREPDGYDQDTIMVPLESRIVVDILLGNKEMVPSTEEALYVERRYRSGKISILYGEK